MDYFGGLEIFRFNHIRMHKEQVDRCIQTHALNYMPRGKLRWQVDGGEECIIEGPIAYWSWPGPHYRYQHIGPGAWEHRFVSCTGERCKQWRRSGLFPVDDRHRPFRRIAQPERFARDFDALLELLARRPDEMNEIVWRIEGLLLQLHSQPADELMLHPRREEIIALREAIDQEPQRAYDFKREAQALDMTTTHLRRLFKRFTGRSPVSYHNEARLTVAAEQLRTGDESIAAIAESLGFSDVFYFTKCFSRQFGQAPGRYRQSSRTMA